MNPEAITTASVMVAIFALAGGANQVVSLWQKLNPRQKPPAGELQGQVDAVAQRVQKLESEKEIAAQRRKAIYEKLEALSQASACALEKMRAEMMHELHELRKQNNADVVALHNRTNEILEAVAELRGEVRASHD